MLAHGADLELRNEAGELPVDRIPPGNKKAQILEMLGKAAEKEAAEKKGKDDL
jgi:hypothetical protein